MGFLDGPEGKESACDAGDTEMWIWSLGWDDPLEKEMATCHFLPGKPHGQKSLEGYSPLGLQRVRHDLSTKEWQQSIHHPRFFLTNGSSLMIQRSHPLLREVFPGLPKMNWLDALCLCHLAPKECNKFYQLAIHYSVWFMDRLWSPDAKN